MGKRSRSASIGPPDGLKASLADTGSRKVQVLSGTEEITDAESSDSGAPSSTSGSCCSEPDIRIERIHCFSDEEPDCTAHVTPDIKAEDNETTLETDVICITLTDSDSDIPIESRVKRESSPESAPEYTALVPDIDIPDSFPALEDLAVEEILNGFIPLQGLDGENSTELCANLFTHALQRRESAGLMPGPSTEEGSGDAQENWLALVPCPSKDVEEPPTFDSPSTFGPPTSCPSPAVPAEYPSPVEPKTYSTPGFLPQPASPFRVSAPPSPLLLEHCIPDDHDSAHHSGVAMEPPEKIRKQILDEFTEDADEKYSEYGHSDQEGFRIDRLMKEAGMLINEFPVPDRDGYLEAEFSQTQAEFRRCYRACEKTENKRVNRAASLSSRRPDLRALKIFRETGRCIHQDFIVGHIPGLAVNTIFNSKTEMKVLGVHKAHSSGISYQPGRRSIALSVCMSKQYIGDGDDPFNLYYTGQGGNFFVHSVGEKTNQQPNRGNKALFNSMKDCLPIRVVKKLCDKVFVYDGLWTILDVLPEMRHGKVMYRFNLERHTDQEPPLTLLEHAKGASEDLGIIVGDISGGEEAIPVPVVNPIDEVLPPGYQRAGSLDREGWEESLPFQYITSMRYSDSATINYSSEPRPYGSKAHEFIKKCNGGMLPYQEDPCRITRFAAVVVECGVWLKCPHGTSCPQAISQQGLRYQLQIYRKGEEDGGERDWGVRALEDIPALSFVCSYVGEVLSVEDDDIDEDDPNLHHLVIRSDISETTYKPLAEHEQRQVAVKYVVSGTNCGNIARFIKFSYKPNLTVQPVLTNCMDRSMPTLCLFSNKRIGKGEELSFNNEECVGCIDDSAWEDSDEGSSQRDTSEIVDSDFGGRKSFL